MAEQPTQMIRGIHHVAVHVNDLDRMISFYRDAFGFELAGEQFGWKDAEIFDNIVGIRGSAARGAMMKAGTCYIELFAFTAPPPAISAPKNPNDKGYTHFCVDVTDIENEYARLQRLGMTFGHREPVDIGVVKTIYGRDPEGNVIEIQEATAECDKRLEDLPTLGSRLGVAAD